MSKKEISITICTIGLIDTDHAMTDVGEFSPRALSTIPISSASDTALSVIKGGAQRWNNVYYPRDMFVYPHLYHIMPETIAALVRYIWS